MQVSTCTSLLLVEKSFLIFRIQPQCFIQYLLRSAITTFLFTPYYIPNYVLISQHFIARPGCGYSICSFLIIEIVAESKNNHQFIIFARRRIIPMLSERLLFRYFSNLFHVQIALSVKENPKLLIIWN